MHLALFPDVADIVPGRVIDLEEDWEILLEIRDAVLRRLEELRVEKTIGKSLEAFVEIEPHTKHPEYGRVLNKYIEALPELFNVSRVNVQPYSSNPDFAAPYIVIAMPAGGQKCERCWRHTFDVGIDARWPSVCSRCAEALDAINFPPTQEAA